MSLSSVSARLTLLALLSASTFYCFYESRRLRKLKLSLQNPKPNCSLSKPKLFFVSQTGTSKALAQRLFDLLAINDLAFDLIDPKDYEPEDLPKETLVLIVASTWEDGKAPASAKFFANWLAESADDFRVGSLLLSNCNFAVFGVGSGAYGATFNSVARDFSKQMRAMGAREVLPVWEGDVDSGDVDEVFDAWSVKVVGFLKRGGVVENGGGEVLVSESDGESVGEDEDSEEEGGDEGSDIVDVEDIAGKAPLRKKTVTVTVAETNGKLNGKKDMVTPAIRASLEKQGYKIIGSHSGVKICRWTKSQLRGRGGCYKHSFYGIESHR
nr:S-adenosyl-L-methionine-dependent tRNA 4-demethylwyosine synthase-like [Quercus suber]